MFHKPTQIESNKVKKKVIKAHYDIRDFKFTTMQSK